MLKLNEITDRFIRVDLTLILKSCVQFVFTKPTVRAGSNPWGGSESDPIKERLRLHNTVS